MTNVLKSWKNDVALITGEEKIIPSNAKYFICTVESMPLEKNVDFVAVDEIQMCADRRKGTHIYRQVLYSEEEKLQYF